MSLKELTTNSWMSPAEKKMLMSYLDKDDIMLEWGSGGSTLELSKLVKTIHSIENNMIWYRLMRNRLKIDNISNAHIHFVKENIERTTKEVRREEYVDYIEYVHKLGIKRFDKVLIDGRARAYCAVEVLDYIDKDSIVFIHDYYDRPRYHWIEKYYDIIDKIEKHDTPIDKSLVVLRKK